MLKISVTKCIRDIGVKVSFFVLSLSGFDSKVIPPSLNESGSVLSSSFL